MTLGLREVNVKEVCAALDWLGMAQPSIADALQRHLRDVKFALGAKTQVAAVDE
jgi:hypothetical protein